MKRDIFRFPPFVSALAFFAACTLPVLASDHADTPMLQELGRFDAMLGDFYAFTDDEDLVLAVTIAARLEDDPHSFRFQPDVTYQFHIDRAPEVSFDRRGGRMPVPLFTSPERIASDVTVTIRFSAENDAPQVQVEGAAKLSNIFAGVRDDPFIRSVVAGRNVAAIVVSTPLVEVLGPEPSSTMIATWVTSDVDDVEGDQDELVGLPYYSQLEQYHALNTTPPSHHTSVHGLEPDVMLFETASAAAFPNGRALEDDIVTLLGRRTGPSDPTKNDVPFLPDFPYLAPPHETDGSQSPRDSMSGDST